MSKRTPGPWHVEEIELYEGGKGIAVIAANGDTICNNQTYYPHALDACNAKLIAAAPDLLEALQALFTDYKQGADSGDWGYWRLEDTDAGKQAIAALNKAYGNT